MDFLSLSTPTSRIIISLWQLTLVKWESGEPWPTTVFLIVHRSFVWSLTVGMVRVYSQPGHVGVATLGGAFSSDKSYKVKFSNSFQSNIFCVFVCESDLTFQFYRFSDAFLMECDILVHSLLCNHRSDRFYSFILKIFFWKIFHASSQIFSCFLSNIFPVFLLKYFSLSQPASMRLFSHPESSHTPADLETNILPPPQSYHHHEDKVYHEQEPGEMTQVRVPVTVGICKLCRRFYRPEVRFVSVASHSHRHWTDLEIVYLLSPASPDRYLYESKCLNIVCLCL